MKCKACVPKAINQEKTNRPITTIVSLGKLQNDMQELASIIGDIRQRSQQSDEFKIVRQKARGLTFGFAWKNRESVFIHNIQANRDKQLTRPLERDYMNGRRSGCN